MKHYALQLSNIHLPILTIMTAVLSHSATKNKISQFCKFQLPQSFRTVAEITENNFLALHQAFMNLICCSPTFMLPCTTLVSWLGLKIIYLPCTSFCAPVGGGDS